MVGDGWVLGGRWVAPGAGGVREVRRPARVQYNDAALVAGGVRPHHVVLPPAMAARVVDRQPPFLC